MERINNKAQRPWSRYILVLILIVAAFLRLFRLSDVPPGVNRDEASIGYTAYSLLKTGKDEYGRPWPVSFQSFGDWKLPLYIYVTIPFVKVFGLSEFSVRLPSALAGTLTVLLTYLLVKELFLKSQISMTNDQRGKKSFTRLPDGQVGHSKSIALLSSLLLAISPWHIHLSRVESESNVAVMLATLGVLLFLKAIKERHWLHLPLASASLALTYATYHGNHMFTTLLLVGVFLLYKKELLSIRSKTLSVCVFAVVTAPVLWHTAGEADRTKLAGIGIFGDPAVVHTRIELPRTEHTQPDSPLARLFHNRVSFAIRTIAQNYLRSFSPEFLFIKGGDNRAHNIQNVGNMHPVEAPLLLMGLVFLLSSIQRRESKLLLWWLFIAPIAASITKDAPHTNRMFAIFPALPIAVALGIGWLWVHARSPRFQRLVAAALFFLYVLDMSYYLEQYYVHFAREESQYWGGALKRVATMINKEENKTKSVVISHPETSPYIFLLFYTRFDPTAYQRDAERYPQTQDHFIHVRQFDRFQFRNVSWDSDMTQPNTIVVTPRSEVPELLMDKAFVMYPFAVFNAQ